MKLGPVTKPDKKNKAMSEKFDDDVSLANCDVIAIFSIYGQSGAIWKLDSGRIVCKTCIFINSNLFILQKLKTELKNLKHSSITIAVSKGTIFAKKCEFLQKILTSAKLSGSRYSKVYFVKLHMYVWVYLARNPTFLA